MKRMTILISMMAVFFLPLTASCSEQQDTPAKPVPQQDSQMTRGQEIYKQVCAACHASGLAGAPKFGNKQDWAPRIALGIDQLVNIAIHGKGSMPPRGGQAGLNDEEIRAAVSYMVENSK